MIAAPKFPHVAALAVWGAGLPALPVVMQIYARRAARRRGLRG